MSGTKLETIAAIGGSYDEIKQEILLAYGQTPEQIWHDLIQVKQGDESFEKEPEPEHPGYYMPHHAVVREAASTTKLRVVFNASASQKVTFP